MYLLRWKRKGTEVICLKSHAWEREYPILLVVQRSTDTSLVTSRQKKMSLPHQHILTANKSS